MNFRLIPTGARAILPAILPVILLPAFAGAQQEESYDYWRFNRDMIQHGQQAVFMCNGLFTGNRTLEQVFSQELAFLRNPVGTPQGGDYVVDWERRAVAIGGADGTPTMRSAFRKGVGCVTLAPDQDFDDIESLPKLDLPYPWETRRPLRGPTATWSGAMVLRQV